MKSGDGTIQGHLFGCRENAQTGHCGVTGWNILTLDYYANGNERNSARFNYTITDENIYHAHLENGNRYIKDENGTILASNTYTSSSFTIDKNIPIFTINWDGAIRDPGTWKVYEFIISNSGVIIQHLIPCINPSGEVGMYDLVTRKFFENNGTGNFIPGPLVS